jgi:hypothetical protein
MDKNKCPKMENPNIFPKKNNFPGFVTIMKN